MSYRFEFLLNTYKELWFESTPRLLNRPAISNRRSNDLALLSLKKQFIELLKRGIDSDATLNTSDKKHIKESLLSFMTQTLELDPWVCQILDNEDYYKVTLNFIDRAKELCPNMPLNGLTQALRNMWVIIALQLYMGEPLQLTDPAFAYSMLYPLTDNYMDSTDISMHDKKSFNSRFYAKIKTNKGEAFNNDELCIFKMIDMITATYNRSDYPDVIQSLLAILDGQNKSLDQHLIKTLYDIDLLGYTFYKGGTSVLADAYLVRGTLSESEALFAFGYGVMLQIADDLEDIDEDRLNTHYTLCNTQIDFGPLDSLYTKYDAFIERFFETYFQQESDEQKALAQLISVSINYLLMNAVYNNSHHFTPLFIRNFKKQSTFSKRALKKLNHKITKQMAP